MRHTEGLPRLMMKPLTSVTYKVHGCKPVAGKFNLHNPETTICFSNKLVIGKHMVARMCEDLAEIMGQPKCTNSQLRSTAIQALRMAEFELEDIQKVSRHVRKETITKHYDPGQRTSTRANMAVAIGQAAAMRRGEVFQPVAPALVRKVSKATVEMATPTQMIPKRSSCLRPVDTSTSTSTLLQGDRGAVRTLFQGGRDVSSSSTTTTLLQGDRGTTSVSQGDRDTSSTTTLSLGQEDRDTSSHNNMAAGSTNLTQGSRGALGTRLMAATSTSLTRGVMGALRLSTTTLYQSGRDASSLNATATDTTTHSQGGTDASSLISVAASTSTAPLPHFRPEGFSSSEPPLMSESECKNLLAFTSNVKVDPVEQQGGALTELEKGRRSEETTTQVDLMVSATTYIRLVWALIF